MTEDSVQRVVDGMDKHELIGDTFDDANILMTKLDPDQKEPKVPKWRDLDPWDRKNPEIYQKYKEQFNQRIEHKKDIAKSIIKLRMNFDITFWKYLNYKYILVVNDAIGVPITMINARLLLSRRPTWRKELPVEKLETRGNKGYDAKEMKRNVKGNEVGLVVKLRKRVRDAVIEFRKYVTSLYIQISQFVSRLGKHALVLKRYGAEKLDEYWVFIYKKKKY